MSLVSLRINVCFIAKEILFSGGGQSDGEEGEEGEDAEGFNTCGGRGAGLVRRGKGVGLVGKTGGTGEVDAGAGVHGREAVTNIDIQANKRDPMLMIDMPILNVCCKPLC